MKAKFLEILKYIYPHRLREDNINDIADQNPHLPDIPKLILHYVQRVSTGTLLIFAWAVFALVSYWWAVENASPWILWMITVIGSLFFFTNILYAIRYYHFPLSEMLVEMKKCGFLKRHE